METEIESVKYPKLRDFILQIIEQHSLAIGVRFPETVDRSRLSLTLPDGSSHEIPLPIPLEDFESVLQQADGGLESERYKNAIKFPIFISLGKSGLLPMGFRITKEIFSEKRPWKREGDIKTDFDQSSRDVFCSGLQKLKEYLSQVVHDNPDLGKGLEEISKDLEHISDILVYYGEGKPLNDTVSIETAGLLKAAVIVEIITIESRRLRSKSKTLVAAIDFKLYELLGVLRGKEFLDTPAPGWLPDYFVSIPSPAQNGEDTKEGGMAQVQAVEMDPLLMIPTRAYQSKLKDISAECVGDQLPLSFLMFDVDNFKHFNESYGHLAGDDVLKTAVGIVSKIVGQKGSLFKYGGDEICVVLPNFSIDEAFALAERMRKAVEGYVFKVKDSDVVDQITISIGVTTVLDLVEDKILIGEADYALRVSKNKGRNQVNVFDRSRERLKEELIVIESVKNQMVKDHARKALEFLEGGRSQEAAINIKMAFDIAFRQWQQMYSEKIHVRFKVTRSLDAYVRDNVLNVNLAEYIRFVDFLPIVIWFESGESQVSIKRSYSEKDRASLQFCVKFLLRVLMEFRRQVEI